MASKLVLSALEKSPGSAGGNIVEPRTTADSCGGLNASKNAMGPLGKCPPKRGQGHVWSDAETEALYNARALHPKMGWKDFSVYWNNTVAVELGFPNRTTDSLKTKFARRSTRVEPVPLQTGHEGETFRRKRGPNKPAEVVSAQVVEESVMELQQNAETETLVPTERISPLASRAKETDSTRPPCSGKSLNKEPSRVSPQNEDNEEPHPDYKEFKKLYRRYWKQVVKDGNRVPLKIPYVIKEKTWRMCDQMVLENLPGPKGSYSLKRLNQIVYTVGLVLEHQGRKLSEPRVRNRAEWYKGQHQEEVSLRRYIGKLTDELRRRTEKRKPTSTQLSNFKSLEVRYGCLRNTNVIRSRLEQLKTHLKLLVNRVSMRKEAESRKMLRCQPLRSVLVNRNKTTEVGDVEQIRGYWAKLIGKKRGYTESEDLTQWARSMAHVKRQVIEPKDDDLDTWDSVVRKTRPRKAAGPDGIPNLLWKKLGTASRALFDWVIRVRERKLRIPGWLTQGRIALLPKGGDPEDPGNYRPIACLNTCYKLVTGLFTRWIEEQVLATQVLPRTQIALAKGVWGCTHAQIVDRAVIVKAAAEKRELNAAWIDYSKAFDSIPHGYMQYILKTIKVHKYVLLAITSMMEKWTVKYCVGAGLEKQVSRPLQVRSGVLQGDTLSPMLFCLAIAPVSHMLHTRHERQTLSGGIEGSESNLNHLYYMDDLKLYSNSQEELDQMINNVENLSGSIGLRMNVKKCAMVSSKGRVNDAKRLPQLAVTDTYKYLGIEQHLVADEAAAWARIAETMKERLVEFLQKDLTVGSTVKGINTMMMPVAKYLAANTIVSNTSFKDYVKKARRFDCDCRAILVEYKFRYKINNVNRLYLDPNLGGLGVKRVEDAMNEALIYTWSYIQCRPDMRTPKAILDKALVQYAGSIFERVKNLLEDSKIDTMVEIMPTPACGLKVRESSDADPVTFVHPTKGARAVVQLLRKERAAADLAEWKTRCKAGGIANSEELDLRLSNLWIKKGVMSKINFRNAIATQEQCLTTNALADKSAPCSRCTSGRPESTPHVVNACEAFRGTLMLSRHNGVCREIYFQLCKKYGVPTTHFTQPVPAVVENDQVKLLYDQSVATKNKLNHNRPDIVVFDKIAKKILVIEVGISWYTKLRNADQRKYQRYAVNSMTTDEFTLPYKPDYNLVGELNDLWAKEYTRGTEVIPIVMGSCGEVMATIMDRLHRIGIPDKGAERLLERLQRAVVIGTSRVIRAHLKK